MARQKRSSRILNKAQRRAASIQSIDTALNLGTGLTVQTYSKHIADLQAKVNSYNKSLSDVDALQNEISEAEQFLRDYSEQMLLGVAVKFGKNSAEYEKAGGIKKRDRKRPTRKAAVAAG